MVPQEEQQTQQPESKEKFFDNFFDDNDQFDINQNPEGGENPEGSQQQPNQTGTGEEGKGKGEGEGGDEGATGQGEEGKGAGEEGAGQGEEGKGEGTGTGEGKGEGEGEGGEAEPKTNETYVNEFEKYMQSLNPDYKAPEELKKDENLTTDKLFSTFEKEIIENKVKDPFVKNYLLRKEEKDFDFNNYVNENSEVNKILAVEDNREFLKNIYKKQGEVKGKEYSDEEIQKELDSMSEIRIDQLADQNRDALKQNINKYYEQQNKNIEKKREQQFNKVEEDNKNKINTFLEEVKSNKRNLPVDMEENELASFVEDAPKLIERDKETGMNIVSELLNDDEFFMDILPFIYKKYKGSLENYQQSQKSKVKDAIKRNLRPNPSQSTRSATAGMNDQTTAKNFFKD